jgi:hypothetical protein
VLPLHTEYVMFLEEDHEVSPDFYTAALAAARATTRTCGDDCWGFSLYAGYVPHVCALMCACSCGVRAGGPPSEPGDEARLVRARGVANTAYALRVPVMRNLTTDPRIRSLCVARSP